MNYSTKKNSHIFCDKKLKIFHLLTKSIILSYTENLDVDDDERKYEFWEKICIHKKKNLCVCVWWKNEWIYFLSKKINWMWSMFFLLKTKLDLCFDLIAPKIMPYSFIHSIDHNQPKFVIYRCCFLILYRVRSSS